MGEEEAVFPGDMAEENHHPSLKRHRRRLCIEEEAEEVYSNKKQASSNDDINSEISNPVDIITSHAAATSSSGGGRAGSSCSGSDSETTTSGGGGVTSSFVLEIPKHLSTTGITRITFKLSKPPKEEEAALWHLPMTTTQERASSNVVSRKKVSDFVSDVKKLLLTGIIDGARVKYISNSPLVSFVIFVCVIWVLNILILLRLFVFLYLF